jgi:hypothetical protein
METEDLESKKEEFEEIKDQLKEAVQKTLLSKKYNPLDPLIVSK